MKTLVDLVKIITRPKLRSVELIGDKNYNQSKLSEFYDKIAEGQFEDDDLAAHALYGVDKQSPAYKKLKKQLRDRLINALFLIDVKQPSFTDRQVAYYQCYKEWAAAKILFGKNARGAALAITQKLYKIARKYEFTELTLDLCHTLRLYFGTIEGNVEKFNEYNEELKVMEKLWICENLVEEYYLKINIENAHSKASKSRYHAEASQYYTEISPLLQTHNSYNLHLYGRLIETFIYASINDHEHTLDSCNRAIDFFSEKEYVPAVPLQVFNYQKAVCHVQLQQLPEALAALDECIHFVSSGLFNWYKAQELKFIICMHQERYDECAEVLFLVLGSNNFSNQPEHLKEIWKIAEAYIVVFDRLGKLSTTNPKFQKFKLARFLNEMDLYSKDKHGMNIHILILEMTFYVLNKDYYKFQDRCEAIEKYRLRYLRTVESQRSNYFFKLLLTLTKGAFKKADVEQLGLVYFKALNAIPIERSKQTLELEIVPYEILWKSVLSTLD